MTPQHVHFLVLSSQKSHPMPTYYSMPSTLSALRTRLTSTFVVPQLIKSLFLFMANLLISLISIHLLVQSVPPIHHSMTQQNSRLSTTFPSTPTFLKSKNTSSVQFIALAPVSESSTTSPMDLVHPTWLVSSLPTASHLITPSTMSRPTSSKLGGSAPKILFFKMVPKSFLSVLIHSIRWKYDSLDFFSFFLTGTCPFGGSNVMSWALVGIVVGFLLGS